MQTRMIDTNILRKKFSRMYSIQQETRSFDENTLLAGIPIKYLLKEQFKGPEIFGENTLDTNFNKDDCVKHIKNYLTSRIEELNNEIDVNKENIFFKFKNFFKKDVETLELKSKIKAINSVLHDESKFKALVDFDFKIFDDYSMVPFYTLDKDQKIFLVIQDPVSYMKIEQAYVKDIFIVETTPINGTPSFEFEYDISYTGINHHLNINQMKKFDGSKCLVNYNFAIFLNLDEAKEHCLKVLNAIKHNVDEKIKNVQNFKEF
jgi:hypothetical protein